MAAQSPQQPLVALGAQIAQNAEQFARRNDGQKTQPNDGSRLQATIRKIGILRPEHLVEIGHSLV